MDKRLLIIHPYDNSTKFLERIKNHLVGLFPQHTHYFSVKPNDDSHQLCLNTIESFNENGLILFMGHGKSNCLFGAKGDSYGTFVSEGAQEENPEQYFYNDNFIHQENVDVFKSNKIISLSCNSNGKIGKFAIEAGAKTFLGFGDLPTSIHEFKEKGEESKVGVSLARVEQIYKSEINYIIKRSIEISISNGFTFEEFYDLIKFITNQRLTHYLINQKELGERKLIANYLYTFKNEICIYGNKKELLIS